MSKTAKNRIIEARIEKAYEQRGLTKIATGKTTNVSKQTAVIAKNMGREDALTITSPFGPTKDAKVVQMNNERNEPNIIKMYKDKALEKRA